MKVIAALRGRFLTSESYDQRLEFCGGIANTLTAFWKDNVVVEFEDRECTSEWQRDERKRVDGRMSVTDYEQR